jgi:replicative DNA helicase
MIGGYRGEEMIIFAGRPGMGKTAMMCTAQLELAKRGIPSLAFSMDMGRRQLWNRYFSQTAGVPVNELERGVQLEQSIVERLTEAKTELVEMPFWVDPYPYRTLSEMRSIIRQMVMRFGIKVVFIDHIGKIKTEKAETRQEEVSKFAQGLKALAKEFNITMVPLVQLNRMVEQRGDKRPMMSDLRESGSIEQEADIILLAYRPEYYNMETFPNGTSSAGKIEIIGSKVRNGEAGSRVLDFEGEYTRIIEKDDQVSFLPTAGAQFLMSMPPAAAIGL